MDIMTPATCRSTLSQANQQKLALQSTWSEYQAQTALLRDMLLLREGEEAEWDQRHSLASQVTTIVERLSALQGQDPWATGLLEDATDLCQEINNYLVEITPMISFMEDESQLAVR